jgi:hypothetical protein
VNLEDALQEALADLDDVEGADVGGEVEWRRGGLPFAALAGDAAEFRLDPLVAKAALRTPDTSASTRGADWVRFGPTVVDAHAVDRAQAWLASAWRRAGS